MPIQTLQLGGITTRALQIDGIMARALQIDSEAVQSWSTAAYTPLPGSSAVQYPPTPPVATGDTYTEPDYSEPGYSV